MAPIVKITANTENLVETQGTILTFSFELSEAPPPAGVTVYLKGNIAQSLTQLDLFAIAYSGGDAPEGDFDFTGFYFNIKSKIATVTLPIFADGIVESPQTVVYTLQPGTGYTVNPSFSAIAVNFFDNAIIGGVGNDNLIGNSANDNLIGNAGNDTLNGGAGNDILIGGSGKDILIGGLGVDRFDYRNLADSLFSSFDVINNFNANAGNDLFLVSTARAGLLNAGSVTTLNAAGIGAKLTTASFRANFAARFTFGSRSFVAINDTTAGFNANTDAIIEVTGLTGTLGINNFTTTLA
ncbi:bluetail domain-containing putative surface protein [Nostoc sp. CHAB 5715]|uniref:bluetail domain-containing putative surface protein n=1 Tax=Nostoc sp. CHAB 5715 TaxID=2780400 RepID=UPI001E3020CE|nr:bluetail domain-containing putative surface protein [Nostoc sp. CHAB 5715]MCC5624391.1 hypothetical protein [Nostoc sp. CHAB 5715]